MKIEVGTSLASPFHLGNEGSLTSSQKFWTCAFHTSLKTRPLPCVWHLSPPPIEESFVDGLVCFVTASKFFTKFVFLPEEITFCEMGKY